MSHRHFINYVLSGFLLVSTLTQLRAQQTAPATPAPSNPAPASQTPAVPPAQGAQPTQNTRQMIEYYRQAKEAGMTDSEIKAAAEQQGISVDDLMRASDGNEPNAVDRSEQDPARKQNDIEEIVQKFIEEDSTGSKVYDMSGSRLPVFGASFFSGAAPTFEPNLRIATPKNYILGPDDELVVDIYGNSVDNIKLRVSPEGTVKMYNLAPLSVTGLTVEQASERIIQRLRQAYSGLNAPGSGTYATITLGNIRSIKIMVTGEVVRPGTYTVSSLATAFNALIASGGPNGNGSFRNIQVIRNNNVIKKIDLYRFLVEGDLNDNIALQDQDILIVRPYVSKIELVGQVKRPGIFELKEGESFADLVNYAGGYRPEAFTFHYTYRRNNGVHYEIGSFLHNQAADFKPQNGDQFTVGKIVETVNNIINLSGAVTRPGIYPFEEKNNTLKKVLNSALGLTPDAFMGRANILRMKEQKNSIISFDLGKLLDNQQEDISLEPGDIIIVKSVHSLNQSASVRISGAVNRPGTFVYYENISIPDLIYNAGGFTKGGVAYRIEISRRVKEDTVGIPQEQNVRIFSLDVSEDLIFNTKDQQFMLQPFDRVFVRVSPRYEAQRIVSVAGEVRFPGSYTILNNSERISDLIPKVGGLKPGASLAGARFIRNGELVALDLTKILNSPGDASDILLQNGDQLTIPTKSDVIKIQGGVLNASIMNHQPSYGYKDYIAQAGGFTENARKNKAYVSYPNGRTKLIRKGAKIEPGSTITVPVKTQVREERMSRGERIAILSLLVTATIAIVRLF